MKQALGKRKKRTTLIGLFIKFFFNYVARLAKIEQITKKRSILSCEIHNLFPLLRQRYHGCQMPQDKLSWT